MLKEKLQTSNRNRLKIYGIYILLLISNIALIVGLANYHTQIGINIDLETIEDISSIIAAMIILGFITVKLPKIREMGDHSIYRIMYLIIICVIGLMSSYFDSKIDTSSIFGPYLEMFKVLCAVLIFVILATNFKPFREIINGEFTRKNQMICLVTFVAVGLFSSYVFIRINDTPANIRCLIVMISGLFGGPVVGIPVGIISGAYRYAIGGPTALPCAISTVISGIIGSLIFIWNDREFPKILPAMILMFLFTGFEMLMVVMMTPQDISFPFVQNIYPVMVFASLTGMLLFSIVIKEAKEKMNPSPTDEEQELEEIKGEYDEKIEELKNEIGELKSEIEEMKKDKN